MAPFAILILIALLVLLLRPDLSLLKPMLRRWGPWLIAAALLLLVATGRAHWLTAAVGAVIPFLMRLYPLLRLFLSARRFRPRSDGQRQQPPTTASLTEREAYEILGLEPGASREDIRAAHRRLIQRLHPDRGGSAYLAARINKAKALLIGKR